MNRQTIHSGWIFSDYYGCRPNVDDTAILGVTGYSRYSCLLILWWYHKLYVPLPNLGVYLIWGIQLFKIKSRMWKVKIFTCFEFLAYHRHWKFLISPFKKYQSNKDGSSINIGTTTRVITEDSSGVYSLPVQTQVYYALWKFSRSTLFCLQY